MNSRLLFEFHQHSKAASFLGVCIAFLTGIAYAAPLMEEGFNYSPGSALAANSPWGGSAGSSISIANGNLTLLSLRSPSPQGNLLQIGGGGSRNVYRTFSATPMSGIPVYCSFLFNCTQLPTNSQFLLSIMSSGVTTPNQPDDPLDLYVAPAVNGYTFAVSHNGDDPATAQASLKTNTTHLIVVKYTFGSGGQASLFIDPTPGAREPAAFAQTTPGEGTDAPNLQIVLFHAPSSAGQGTFQFDTLRLGTNWEDVTPLPANLTITGPGDVAICSGSPAFFSATVTGTPPFAYKWRANAIPISGATASSFTIPNPSAGDALKGYDVIVTDTFGSSTSRVAALQISQVPPSVKSAPLSQIVYPGTSNVLLSVQISGDGPLVFQWRTNGVPIANATNDSLAIVNPSPSDALNFYDVIIANPCGSVTSSPPAQIIFPHAFFNCEALPGFFFGMNLITTNPAAVNLFLWSSPDPAQPITNWSLEGQLSEQPLNDGTGNSRYSINVNPLVSPVYYIIGTSVSPPYVEPVPVEWITTDSGGNYYFFGDSLFITPDGLLGFPTPPSIVQQPIPRTIQQGQTLTYNCAASGSEPLLYQWFQAPTTRIDGATNATLVLTRVRYADAGDYFVVVTNLYGGVTSAPASLAVVSPPLLTARMTLAGFQIEGHGIPGQLYQLEAAAIIGNASAWNTLAITVADLDGSIRFTDTNTPAYTQRYYRLVSPELAPTAPTIIQQPADVLVLEGKIPRLSFLVAGAAPLGCQWFGSANEPLSSGTNMQLVLPPATLAGGGKYFAVVTESFGSVTSRVATVAVLTQPKLTAQFFSGAFAFSGKGVAGDLFYVQTATNMRSNPGWVTIQSNRVDPNGLLHFVESAPPGAPSRFFRVLFP